jgi:hypothetical protein
MTVEPSKPSAEHRWMLRTGFDGQSPQCRRPRARPSSRMRSGSAHLSLALSSCRSCATNSWACSRHRRLQSRVLRACADPRCSSMAIMMPQALRANQRIVCKNVPSSRPLGNKSGCEPLAREHAVCLGQVRHWPDLESASSLLIARTTIAQSISLCSRKDQLRDATGAGQHADMLIVIRGLALRLPSSQA